MNNATLFIDGKPVGGCVVNYTPEPCGVGPAYEVDFRFSATLEGRIKMARGKKTRTFKNALLRLSMSNDAWDAVRFYHRVKRHQERKRQRRKVK